MMQVIQSAEIAQADGIQSRVCVHDVFLSEIEKEQVAACNYVMINITINSDYRF